MIIVSLSTYDHVKEVLEKSKDIFIHKFAGFYKGENCGSCPCAILTAHRQGKPCSLSQ